MQPVDRRPVLERFVRMRQGAIFKGSSALSTSLLVVAAGGALFWAVAARVTSSDEVGRVAALSSVIAFLVFLTALGLVPMVARYGAGNERSERVVHNLALAFASATGALLAAVFALVTWAMGLDQFQPAQSTLGVVAMVAIAAGASFTVIVEIRLLSQGRYGWIIGRSTGTAILSVGLVLALPAGSAPLALFVIGSGVAAASGPVVWLLAERRAGDRFAVGPLPDNLAQILRYLAVSWAGTVVGKVAGVALPLVVALQVSADDNARFFVAWNIALVVFVLVQSVGTALLADGGRSSALAGQTRHSLFIGLVLATVLVVAAEVGAPLVGRVYGSDYAAAADVLRILVLAAFPLVVFATANAVAQVRHMSRAILALPLLLTAGVYLPIAFGAGSLTVTSAAVAWVAGAAVAGLASVAVLVGVRDRPFVAVPRVATVDSQAQEAPAS